jgi:hypothetical protein
MNGFQQGRYNSDWRLDIKKVELQESQQMNEDWKTKSSCLNDAYAKCVVTFSFIGGMTLKG